VTYLPSQSFNMAPFHIGTFNAGKCKVTWEGYRIYRAKAPA